MSALRPSIEQIERRLLDVFPDAVLQIDDESHLHAGHAGAQGGAGHFKVTIACSALCGKPRLAAHRLVYDALAAWIPSGIHALSIHVTPLHANEHPSESA
jgi:BolA protein